MRIHGCQLAGITSDEEVEDTLLDDPEGRSRVKILWKNKLTMGIIIFFSLGLKRKGLFNKFRFYIEEKGACESCTCGVSGGGYRVCPIFKPTTPRVNRQTQNRYLQAVVLSPV